MNRCIDSVNSSFITLKCFISCKPVIRSSIIANILNPIIIPTTDCVHPMIRASMLAGFGGKISMRGHCHSGICTRCAGLRVSEEVYISPVATTLVLSQRYCARRLHVNGLDCLSLDAADQASLIFSSVEGK